MKEHNQLVRFKNAFAGESGQEKLGNILIQDSPVVVAGRLGEVAQLYRSLSAEHGYQPSLAYRVIILHLLSPQPGFDCSQEILRFFRQVLSNGQLQGIQLCFDLLLVKEAKAALSTGLVRVLKVRLLRALQQYYNKVGNRKDRRKCGQTLATYCKQSLNRQQIRRKGQYYQQILDALLGEIKREVSGYVIRKRGLSAVQSLTNLVGLLEKSEQIVSSKYQNELLEAYWALATLHNQLHYLAFTRKYASIALNIATRLSNTQRAQQIRHLIESLS